MLDPKHMKLQYCNGLMSGGFPRLLQSGLVDAIFVYGRAADEWQNTEYDESVLRLTAELHHRTGGDVPVIIPGYCGKDEGQGENGYPGPGVWKPVLVGFGVPEYKILTPSGTGHNTKTEMEDCIRLAKDREWSTILAVTTPIHVLRAMLGTVESLQSRGSTLKVAPVYTSRYDLSRSCYGSQGEGPFPRRRWINEEAERVSKYAAKGDMASLEELSGHLESIYEMCEK